MSTSIIHFLSSFFFRTVCDLCFLLAEYRKRKDFLELHSTMFLASFCIIQCTHFPPSQRGLSFPLPLFFPTARPTAWVPPPLFLLLFPTPQWSWGRTAATRRGGGWKKAFCKYLCWVSIGGGGGEKRSACLVWWQDAMAKRDWGGRRGEYQKPLRSG